MSERRVTVRGESMSPRLSNGAEIVYDDEQFLNVAPVRGDLVLVSYLGEMMVKQVVAVPGDELGYELVSGAIYRLKVNESVATNSAGSEYHFNDRQVGMLRLYGGVLDGCYCVMSDSMDGYGSHNFGCLEVEEFCYHWTARPDSD